MTAYFVETAVMVKVGVGQCSGERATAGLSPSEPGRT